MNNDTTREMMMSCIHEMMEEDPIVESIADEVTTHKCSSEKLEELVKSSNANMHTFHANNTLIKLLNADLVEEALCFIKNANNVSLEQAMSVLKSIPVFSERNEEQIDIDDEHIIEPPVVKSNKRKAYSDKYAGAMAKFCDEVYVVDYYSDGISLAIIRKKYIEWAKHTKTLPDTVGKSTIPDTVGKSTLDRYLRSAKIPYVVYSGEASFKFKEVAEIQKEQVEEEEEEEEIHMPFEEKLDEEIQKEQVEEEEEEEIQKKQVEEELDEEIPNKNPFILSESETEDESYFDSLNDFVVEDDAAKEKRRKLNNLTFKVMNKEERRARNFYLSLEAEQVDGDDDDDDFIDE